MTQEALRIALEALAEIRDLRTRRDVLRMDKRPQRIAQTALEKIDDSTKDVDPHKHS